MPGSAADGVGAAGAPAVHAGVNGVHGDASADGLGGSWADLQQLRAQSVRINALSMNNQVRQSMQKDPMLSPAASSLQLNQRTI